MEYAKLENGKLTKLFRLPSGTCVLSKKLVRNPTESDILEAGYLPIEETEEPESRDGYIKSFRWVQTDSAIVRKWTVKRDMRPLSQSAVIDMLIAQQINTLTVDDNTALRMRSFYPHFDDIVGQEVKQGFRFCHGGKLWATVKALTIQKHYPPGDGMESLYTKVNEQHDGTLEDPIPYDGNMVLEQGKYYSQNDSTFHCYRDTINPVYVPLAGLVGSYVEVAE
jgi:hypothetical protein